MKLLCLSIFLFFFTVSAHAQIQRQSTSTTRIIANIDLVNSRFEVQGNVQQQGSLIQDLTVSMHYDAIEFAFNLQRSNANQYYHVTLTANLDGRPITIHDGDLFGFYGENLTVTQTGKRKLEWINLLERYIQWKGELVLVLNAELWGPRSVPLGVDCLEEPQFTSKQIWPHYVAAGIGGAALIASAIVGNESSDIYDNDYKAQLLEEKAESFYQDANDKHHTELIFRYTGIGILAADAAVLIYRYYRYKRRLSIFQEYCQPEGVSFTPYYQSTRGTGPSNSLGVRFTYNF